MKYWQFISARLAIKITERLRILNVSPAYLANRSSLTPIEVFDCLSGVRDFTLEDIVRLEDALDMELVTINKSYEVQI